MRYNDWVYHLNEEEHKTIEAVNKKGERVWIKFIPINAKNQVTVAHILDRPDEVQWKVKCSHIEVINPITGQAISSPIAVAGSMSVQEGQTMISKEPSSEVYVFPLNPTTEKNVNEFEVVGHLKSGSTFSINTDAPTWIGYVSSNGKVSKINQGI